MPTGNSAVTARLIDKASEGDLRARQQLLERHRDRLNHMVALRLDRRLAPRVDPSDIVQEALAQADHQLDGYLKTRAGDLPFYPWVRQFAWEKVLQNHRRHIGAQRRTVNREEWALPDDSAALLAGQLASQSDGPIERAMREEMQERVRAVLAQLPPRDREVLALIYLEQMSYEEVAGVLGVKRGAVRMRHLRALERLSTLLRQRGFGEGSR